MPYDQDKPAYKSYKPYQRKETPEDLNPEFYKPFALAFNQDIPESITPVLEAMVNKLNELGYTARLGGNLNLEELIEQKMERKEVHLPWRDFNKKESKLTFNTKPSFILAKQFSPVYDRLPDAVKAMLARNVRLILGYNLKSPLLFLITWSRDGVESAKHRTAQTGNVGHVIAMADMLRVPIFNISRSDSIDRLKQYLQQNH